MHGSVSDLQLGAQQLVGGHSAGDYYVTNARLSFQRPNSCPPCALLQMRQRHPLERGCNVRAHLRTHRTSEFSLIIP